MSEIAKYKPLVESALRFVEEAVKFSDTPWDDYLARLARTVIEEIFKEETPGPTPAPVRVRAAATNAGISLPEILVEILPKVLEILSWFRKK